MAYRITVENKKGEQLELTNNPNYDVKATGLSPVTSDIITTPVANYGGAKYVTSRKQTRNIVLTIFVKTPVEANRLNLYKYINTGEWIRVYIKNNTRDVYIDGYVDDFDCDLFTQTQTAQVSIICPKSQFMDIKPDVVKIGTIVGAFSFPFYTNDDYPITFSIYDAKATLVNNESDNNIGFIYTIQCYGKVVNPILYLENTGEYFKINRTFPKDSVITISTLDGKKSVKCDLRGHVTNIINDLDSGSTWLKLKAGYNHLLQTAESGVDNMVGELYYNKEYEGV